MRIFLLEDNADRLREFTAVVSQKYWSFSAEPCRSATRAIDILTHQLSSIDLICLDHDLETPTGEPDCGTGMDVVHWLVSQPIRKPVLIHTTNTTAGREMEATLKAAAFSCYWLVPFDGNEWIKSAWPIWVEKLTGDPK